MMFSVGYRPRCHRARSFSHLTRVTLIHLIKTAMEHAICNGHIDPESLKIDTEIPYKMHILWSSERVCPWRAVACNVVKLASRKLPVSQVRSKRMLTRGAREQLGGLY